VQVESKPAQQSRSACHCRLHHRARCPLAHSQDGCATTTSAVRRPSPS